MTDRQAARLSHAERNAWYAKASSASKRRPAGAWFAPNSREQIRDETVRLGLIPNAAVIERRGVPTTSPLPKYALAAEFASLFQESLKGPALDKEIARWRSTHLSRAALARIALIKKGAVKEAKAVEVRYPSGHSRTLAPGPSSVLSKAVIEDFAPRYLEQPAVLWLSESASKVREYDRELAATLGLRIDPAKDLPDIILADLGRGVEVLIVFVEVVATDGPINQHRKRSLLEIARDAGFEEKNVAFLTVFLDRNVAAFKKAVPDLAWGSFTWFMAEPDALMVLREGKPVPLSTLR